MIDGGPAFPGEQGYTPQGWNQTWGSGMSLRDWFAGMALQGMLASPSDLGEILQETSKRAYAVVAYNLADAMLAERDRDEDAATS